MLIFVLLSLVVEISVKQLLNLVNTCEEWELKAKVCLQARYVDFSLDSVGHFGSTLNSATFKTCSEVEAE